MSEEKQLTNKITVKYGILRKMVDALDNISPNEETEVPFEYVIGSCFPNIFDNIKKELHIQYTNGYVAGLEEGRKIDEEENLEYSS